ncbi:hypothetical protein F5884DRAFT_462375 [Xylogone sp. PMI_703]|nr:hypothetical protein F5884DRAFT_462375 [Xylogone sp. PMI_703]
MVTRDEEAAVVYGAREDGHPDDPIEETGLLSLHEMSDDDSPPTPRFLQDLGAWRDWKWVPVPVRRFSRAVVEWAKGPSPPQVHHIDPIFPRIQEAPSRLLNYYFPKRKHKVMLLIFYYFLWMFTFGVVMHEGTVATQIEGYGTPHPIGCGNVYWVHGNRCGLNGNNCRPFNGTSFAFRCPGNCASTWILEPRAVGAQEVNYRPLVIGGPEEEDGPAIYRGDSFICGSAIHAGVIDSAVGGCGVVSLVGEHHNYPPSKRNGIESIGFDSYFPSSFTFGSSYTCVAKDQRWNLLFVSLTFTVVLSLFTTSPSVFFFSMFTGLFAHVGMASDPPPYSTIPELVSNLLGKFLPAAFVAFVIYKFMGGERALTGLTAHIEKTVLWLGGLWFGSLSNYTLDWIPIQRLNAHDIKQQPGGFLALAIIITLLASIVVQQVFNFRREGRLIRYLGIYGTFVGSILLSLLLPGLSLRIHHYILALLFLPGTSMQTRTALLYQGILLGLFINGVARWGYSPVLETPDALRGDAQHNSKLPTILRPTVALGMNISTISFNWALPFPDSMNGISILVNDVERYRGYKGDRVGIAGFEWTRNSSLAEPEYFRFAYMQDTQTWDYTKAGTWHPDGSWTEMQPGPSKIKRSEADKLEFIE